MSRVNKMLDGLAVESLVGAEIGPLDKPFIAKSRGNVIYVDHCDTEALKRRWATDPNVNCDVLHVDAVWGERSLREAIEAAIQRQQEQAWKGLDYVVASHVVEHVPDLITWLREVKDALSDSGSLRLAVPDKRFTFDYFRRTSSLTEVVYAYSRRRRAPGGDRVLDFALNMVTMDCKAAWDGTVDVASLARGYTFHEAVALARDAEEAGTYHDVHCWTFTPASFCDLCAQLAAENLLEFECERIIGTARYEYEFFVWMRPCTDYARNARSWRDAEALVLNKSANSPSRPNALAKLSGGFLRRLFQP